MTPQRANSHGPQLLTARVVATLLELDRHVVAGAMRAGQLPTVQVGARLYVPAGLLRAWLGLPPTAPIEPTPISRVRFAGRR
jgi:hypothetical protein